MPASHLTYRALLDAAARESRPEAWWQAQERSCLLIEADERPAAVDPEHSAALCSWLRRLPCPVVALADDEACTEVLSACDTRTARRGEAAAIVRSCEHSPLAALALVQVLRLAEHQPAEDALITESLAYAMLQAGPEFQRWHSRQTSSEAVPDSGPAVCIERHADQLSIQLNRPHAGNALNVAMRDALVEGFDLVAADPSIALATVSGVGRCYSVGGDVREFGLRSDAPSAHRIRSLQSPARSLLRCAQRAEFRVHRACIGSGVELAAFGARVHAHRDAYFQLPELKFGLIPGSGGCVSLPRRIGRQRTALLALTGRRLRAHEALAWGLVDELID